MSSKTVTFCTSRDLDIPLKVRIKSLDGHGPLLKESTKLTDPLTITKLSNYSQVSDLFISLVVTIDEKPLTVPVTTSYASFNNSRKWNQWITLPINVNQLPFRSKLKIIIWEFEGVKESVFGVTEIKLFDTSSDCTLKRGRQKLKVNTSELGDQTIGDTQMDELDKLKKQYENGDMIAIDWLDALTFKRIDQIEHIKTRDSDFILFVDLEQFDMPVVYSELKYPPPVFPTYSALDQLSNQENQQKIKTGKTSTLRVFDPEQYQTDPIEQKFRKLERSHKDGPLDRQIKPTARIRDELNNILNYSSVQELSQYEKNLVWKFRYFLINNKKGLNKLLKSVNFTEENEKKEALKLLNRWVDIDIEDALELLGAHFTNFTVRFYAVERLRKASDNELELYLLQLVQALGYETSSNDSNKNSGFSLVELTGSSFTNEDGLSPLSQFLLERALLNERLGSFFYWYLNVEASEKPNSIYKKILDYYMKSLGGELQKEIDFVNQLVQLCTKIKSARESTPKKIELLRSILDTKFKNFSPVRLPLNPSIEVCGIISSESSVFKSSLSPLKLTFKTLDGGKYQLMFKVGDDLRQDQLVIQIIILMNKLLNNENVDLKLTPYKILATDPTAGAIQFIPNSTIASVLAEYHGILPYLRHHNPDSSKELGVSADAMDNFVKSCAGYCVITYILGVGDRHLDNLLICPDGHFFHADFGYILGQDPKPFPPLMKLPPQIIDAFGGAESANYNKFRNYCFVAYSILRKNSNLILNLFELMRNSSIPAIALERDAAVLKVKEKFCLDMSEEEAIIHFQNLINDSVNALLPIVIDRLHSLAQYWRA